MKISKKSDMPFKSYGTFYGVRRVKRYFLFSKIVTDKIWLGVLVYEFFVMKFLKAF